jgi:Mg-chelatase subunit ChlD
MKNILITATLATFLAIHAAATVQPPPPEPPNTTPQPPVAKPVVDVVFVLDSTGSMSGLIEGAKEKIWSIANSIVGQKPSPAVRIGLLSYRDRSDDYVTRKFDLTEDIDTVFKNLQTFKAGGGGDTPESVNQALHEAVTQMTWATAKDATKIIFLVGDCPPHMDYQDDVKYPVTCQKAARSGVIINTVQCGNHAATTPVWQEIARLAEGSYIALAQTGGMVAMTTPHDAEIAKLSAAIGETSIAYGSAAQQQSVREKNSVAKAAPAAVAASRADYNTKTGGKAIQGRGDLVADVAEGKVAMDQLKDAELPPELQKMTPAERKAHLDEQRTKRAALNQQLEGLVRRRGDFIEQEKARLAKEGKGDSFDLKVEETIKAQVKRNQK